MPVPGDLAEIRARAWRLFCTEVAVDADGRLVRWRSAAGAVRGLAVTSAGGKLDPPDSPPRGSPTGDLLIAGDDGTVTIMGREKDVASARPPDITEIERRSHYLSRCAWPLPVPDRGPASGRRADRRGPAASDRSTR